MNKVLTMARNWKHNIDIAICDSCNKGPMLCVELPYCDSEIGIREEYRCFACAEMELEE